jgi:hypothetical protein
MAAGGAGGTAVRWGGIARSPTRAKKGHVELELALLPTPETASWPMHARKPRGVREGGRVALRPRDTRVDAAHRCCAGGGAKNRWVHRDVADASVRRAALQSPRAWHGQSARGRHAERDGSGVQPCCHFICPSLKLHNSKKFQLS